MNHSTANGEHDVLARLGAALPTLPRKMAQLAAFIEHRYVQVAFMSTRELARAAGISLATVVRFPAALGYRNYEEFRTSLEERVNIDLSGVDRWRTLRDDGRSYGALLRRIVDADTEALRALGRDFQEAAFGRFVQRIQDAGRVTILGFRYVSPLTTYFAYSLSKVKPSVHGFTKGDSSLYDRIRLMDRHDLVVAIAFARYPADLVALVRYARTRRIAVLAITDSHLSPLLPLASVSLFAKAAILDFVGSLAAPAALINGVVSAVGARLREAAARRLEAVEEAAHAAGIYVQPGGRTPVAVYGLPDWSGDGRAGAARRTGAMR